MFGCSNLNQISELKPRSFHFDFAVWRDSAKLREAKKNNILWSTGVIIVMCTLRSSCIIIHLEFTVSALLLGEAQLTKTLPSRGGGKMKTRMCPAVKACVSLVFFESTFNLVWKDEQRDIVLPFLKGLIKVFLEEFE